MAFESNGTAILDRASYSRPPVSQELVAAKAPAEELFDPDSSDWLSLADPFQDLTWQTVVPIATIVLTLVFGAFLCALFFTVVA